MNDTPIPVPFDDAVILIRVRPVQTTKEGLRIPENQQDKERRVGRVVAVGPGKVMGAATLAKRNTRAVIDGLRVESEPTEADPAALHRYPMNVQVGDVVVFSGGAIIEPYGPFRQEYVVTRNELITCKLPEFVEEPEHEAKANTKTATDAPGLLVPGPGALVNPTTGMPFRPEGRARA